ncbi:hypothetical protein FRB95_007804 [Tulasnella sp. JGI-2019a]|nr:hypothetical protein FRB95_007804 [Tulasnella sp. JGI-2019a]
MMARVENDEKQQWSFRDDRAFAGWFTGPFNVIGNIKMGSMGFHLILELPERYHDAEKGLQNVLICFRTGYWNAYARGRGRVSVPLIIMEETTPKALRDAL